MVQLRGISGRATTTMTTDASMVRPRRATELTASTVAGVGAVVKFTVDDDATSSRGLDYVPIFALGGRDPFIQYSSGSNT
jgi:hypothetical protein